MYDALSQRRSYKNDYPPNMIYDLMMREKGRAFEPQLLDKLFKIIGVWPVGTIVRLSDGRIAVVREENEDDIFSPKVEVISPLDKKETIDLKKEEAKIKIERSLNPLSEKLLNSRRGPAIAGLFLFPTPHGTSATYLLNRGD